TIELALDGSPRTSVDYDYAGKQPIPAAGLSPARHTALWAANGEQSSSGGACVAASSALFKPDVQVSRIRLARIHSIEGMHRKPTTSRSQELQAKALHMGIGRLPFRRPVGALAPTLQVTRQAEQYEAVQLTKAVPGIAVTKVCAPALEMAIDLFDHH